MSTSTIVARSKATGHHVLKIHGYSHTKAVVATGEHVLSRGFPVGGRTWRIMYYPNGKRKEQSDWISVGLNVEPDAAKTAVKALFRLSILDMNGEPVAAYTSASSTIRTFPSVGRNDGYTFNYFVSKLDLERSAHLRNDVLAIRCDIEVMRDVRLHVLMEEKFLGVPEPDLHAHLARLLHTKEGADVEFKVGDETLAAHRCILAARSPVFKAELSSSTAGTSIKIDDMDDLAFRALLQFIYTEALPEMTAPAVARQLLAAAGRYQVARLKAVCEDKLSRSLDKITEQKLDSAATAQIQRHHGRHRRWFMGLRLKLLNWHRLQRQQPQCSLHSTVTPINKACADPAPSPSASTIVVSETTGHHVLKIEGYTRTKMILNNGEHFCSGEFKVGGHTWRLKYYPKGESLESTSFISMRLESTSIGATDDDVHGKVELSITLPGHAGEQIRLCTFYDPKLTFTKNCNGVTAKRFVTRAELESSRYLKDDCFTVRCELTVFVKEVRAEPLETVPPPVLPRHLCQLLSSQECSDVSFKVGRETFAAHRCLLAARSSVFKAELLGPMREHKEGGIRVDDIDAAVFRALLHFIYTDELPTTTEEEATTMAQHLLVAADRYDMDRLKLVCEDKLCRHLDTTTAATTLALAEQHQCPRLKEAIFAFLCSSSANLRAVVASDGYDHLTSSCPTITQELLVRLAAAL
jgi:speckle-type POZ protein